MMKTWTCAIAALLMTGAMQVTGQQQPATQPSAPAGQTGARPSLVLGDSNTVRLPAVTTTVTASNVAGLDAMSAEQLAALGASLTITDSGVARGPDVDAAMTFGTASFVGRSGATALTWRVSVDGRAAPESSHTRLATVRLGLPAPVTYALEYTLTTKPVAPAQWAVRGAADVWAVSWSDPAKARVYGLVVENQDQALAGVRLARSTLKDAWGRALGLDQLQLVSAADGAGGTAVTVAPNTAVPLFVRLEDTDRGLYGTFDGVIGIAADGTPGVKDVPLKVYVSSRARKFLGVLLAFIGLLVAAGSTALLRPALARLQIRRATAGMRAVLADFVEEMEQTMPDDVPSPVMKETARTLSASLSDTALDNELLLPPLFSLPGAEPVTEMAPKLKERLDAVAKKAEGLFVLLRAGSPRLLALLERDRPAAMVLLTELDQAAAATTSASDAQARIKTIHDKINTAKEAAQKLSERPIEVRNIELQIRALSFAAWSVWLVIALIVGVGWIVADVDYGTATDLVTSFLWGFGITTFGAGVQNLTPGSVTTQLNFKLPK